MSLSVLDLFKIGIGPSSSHTVGPMRAAGDFVQLLAARGLLQAVERVRIDLYGSLALTGRGHATDKAVLLGLSGELPDTVDPECVTQLIEDIRALSRLTLAGQHKITFTESADLVFHMNESLPTHPNGMRFTASAASGNILATEIYYSVGGGFIVRDGQLEAQTAGQASTPRYEFTSASELLAIGTRTGLSIADIMRENEKAFRTPEETDGALDRIWIAMNDCIERGCQGQGILPGGLGVKKHDGDARASSSTICKQAWEPPIHWPCSTG